MAALLESTSPQPLTSIRLAHPRDASALASFAARTFRETFEADNTAEDMALYLAANYGAERQAVELRDPGIVTLLAEDGRRLAGYSQLHEGPAPDCVRVRRRSRSGGSTWTATGRDVGSRRHS